jgi:molecular chaperone GrpE (heat shock protein)
VEPDSEAENTGVPEAVEPAAAPEEPQAGMQPAPEPAAPGAPEPVAEASIQNLCESVVDHLRRFESQLSDFVRGTSTCSRAAFDQLYEEMQGYKKNFLREAQRPLLLDLILLYDSIDSLCRNYERATDVNPAILVENLDALRVETETILGRVGIERLAASPEKLNVSLQRAIKTIPTDKPEEHLAVVETVKAGFFAGESPVRKEQVVVKKYKPAGVEAGPGPLEPAQEAASS